MPELPEVETVKRQLEKRIVGKRISSIKILSKKQFLGNFQKTIGQQIDRLWRRAKILAINVGRLTLLVHLKMTGQIIYLSKNRKPISVGHPLPFSPNQLPNKTTRVIIELEDGSRLFFNDLRKFGWIKLLDGDKIEKELSGLGPEPLEKDFSLDYFSKKLANTRRMIKIVLMDQAVVAGIGNIYASEILFEAGINPARQANSLSNREVANLYRAIKKILLQAIDYGGTSAADQAYIRPDASPGRYQNKLRVYQREGKECFGCFGKVKRIKQANRSTFFCSSCQQ
ncbi:MAG: bifunctional DNA-formamidopyrimidine glycosylase/DNA-(apurinic or apyrimidinic site) lyase [Candidatus Shapirobacteria bacterium]|nr:bifunctional DNA-formamidopyrimidine glycosylase/DNA-(apurinic or apyrimidinic site) lyase [Candidatus Shapirobacteria bacterium]